MENVSLGKNMQLVRYKKIQHYHGVQPAIDMSYES